MNNRNTNQNNENSNNNNNTNQNDSHRRTIRIPLTNNDRNNNNNNNRLEGFNVVSGISLPNVPNEDDNNDNNNNNTNTNNIQNLQNNNENILNNNNNNFGNNQRILNNEFNNFLYQRPYQPPQMPNRRIRIPIDQMRRMLEHADQRQERHVNIGIGNPRMNRNMNNNNMGGNNGVNPQQPFPVNFNAHPRFAVPPRNRRIRQPSTIHDYLHLFLNKFHRFVHKCTKYFGIKESLKVNSALFVYELYEMSLLLNCVMMIGLFLVMYLIYKYSEIVGMLITGFFVCSVIDIYVVKYRMVMKNSRKRWKKELLPMSLCFLCCAAAFYYLKQAYIPKIFKYCQFYVPSDVLEISFSEIIWRCTLIDISVKLILFQIKLLLINLCSKRYVGKVLSILELLSQVYRTSLPSICFWIPFCLNKKSIAFSFFIIVAVIARFLTEVSSFVQIIALIKRFKNSKYGNEIDLKRRNKRMKKKWEDEGLDEKEVARRLKELEDQSCTICMEDEYDKPRELSRCHHVFCYKCIKQWFKKERKYFCPLCRFNYGYNFLPFYGKDSRTFTFPILI